MAEFAVVDEIDPGFFLLADDPADRVLEFAVVGRLVELLTQRLLLAQFEKLGRARQASHVRRQDPVSHVFLPIFFHVHYAEYAPLRATGCPRFYQKPLTVGKRQRGV